MTLREYLDALGATGVVLLVLAAFGVVKVLELASGRWSDLVDRWADEGRKED